MFSRTLTFFLGAFLLFAPVAAFADCTNPTGPAGTIVYNADQNVPQVCIKNTWMALAELNPSAGPGSCSNPTGIEGAIVYNQSYSTLQFCNGTDWIGIASPFSPCTSFTRAFKW